MLRLVSLIAGTLQNLGIEPNVAFPYVAAVKGFKKGYCSWVFARMKKPIVGLHLEPFLLWRKVFWSRDRWDCDFYYTYGEALLGMRELKELVGEKPKVEFKRPNKDIDYKGSE